MARKLLLSAFLLLLFALPRPATAQVLDHVVGAYRSVGTQWLDRLLPVAQKTFTVLATIELAVSAILWALRRTSVDQICASFLLKFLVLSFCYMLISFFPYWIPAISGGFEHAGQIASGSTSVSPSNILELGNTLTLRILLTAGGTGIFEHPSGNIVATLVAIAVWVCYALIAVQVLLVLVETSVVLSTGILFLAFAGFRGTAPLADNFLLYAVRVGVRIFFLYALLAVGTTLVPSWNDLIFTGSVYPFNLTPFFEVLAGSLCFVFIIWRIPAVAADRLTAQAHFRLGDALRAQV